MAFGVTSYTDGAVGILSATVVSIDQGLTGISANNSLRTQEYRYNLYLGPSQNIDNKTVTTFLDPSTAKKTEILGIGNVSTFDAASIFYVSESAAKSAAGSLYGLSSEISTDGVISDTDSYLSASMVNPSSGTYTAGDAVIDGEGAAVGTVAITRSLTLSGLAYTGLLQIEDWANTISIGTTLIASGITTIVTSINYIGVGKVYKDVVAVSNFPNLEPPNTGVDNPLSGLTDVALTSSNAGQGVGNTFYANGCVTNTYADYVNVQGGVPYMGNVLAFDTTADPTSASQIATLRADVGVLRTGITSYVSAAVSVKDMKYDASLNVWVLTKTTPILEQQKTGINNAINVLEDPTFQS
tara:strand:- start:3020 stop:4084 length:1065 start_codon:yes stop_codon:yes gene_type:complete